MKRVLALIITLPLVVIGAEWQSLNGPPAGRADDMSMGLYEGQWVIYAADQTHKLYKSTNEGELWQVPTSQIEVDNPVCIITSKNNAQIVYLAKVPESPNAHCVWKSEDGGQTWNPRDDGIGNISPLCLAVDPLDVNANFVLLGSAKQSGSPVYYRTTNGGERWEPRTISTNYLDVYDIAVVPGSPRRVYLAGGGYDVDAGFYLSTDDGNTFQRTLIAETRAVAYDANNPLNVWVGEIAGDRIGVRRSTDGGLNWSVTYLLPEGNLINALAIPISDRIYAGTDAGVFISTDGGQTWTKINNGIYIPQVSDIIVKPDDPQHLFISGDACIYRSTDGGQSWYEKTAGFKLHFTVGVSTSLPGALYVLGDKTVHKSTDNGLTWITIDNGYTYGCRYAIAADATNSERAFHVGETAYDVNYVRRTTNGGQSWVNLFEGINATYTSIAVDPTNGQIVYLGFRDPPPSVFGLQKSTDGGDTWINITPGNDIVSISVDLWSYELVFAGNDGTARSPLIYKSTNGGLSWDTYNISGTGMVFDICSNSLSNKIYARLGDGVYKSRDGGVTWTNCGFLGQNIGALAMDYGEPEILYVASNELPAGRTFLTVDGGAVWIEIPNQLPDNAIDIALDVNHPTSIYAATSNGVYSLTPAYQFKSLTSSSSLATSANNGRKLLHI